MLYNSQDQQARLRRAGRSGNNKEVIHMARLEQKEQKEQKKELDTKFLSVVFDKDFQKQHLEEKERSKVELFERGLAGEISTADTIEKTVEKIVKMALTCEFSASLAAGAGANKMISVISRGILSDSKLRRSALIIADRFATNRKIETVTIRKRGKAVING
ncbi:MAG: hypothetical protein ABH860_02970 [bacterium]